MTLKSNAIITVDEFLILSDKDRNDFITDMFSIYNGSADATGATVQVSTTALVLVVTGGTNAHSNSLAFATYTTIGALITAIDALNKGWIVTRLTASAQASINLFALPATSALLVANEQTLQGFNGEYIDSLINSASDFIENYCNRHFISATYTEYYDGTGENKLLLKNFPITVFTSLISWEYITQVALYAYTEHTEFEVYYDEGVIYLPGYFSKGHKNFKIVYTAGYTSSTMPSDVKNACSSLATMANAKKDKQGISSERIGAYSVSYDKSSGTENLFMGVVIPSDILTILNSYKRLDYTEFQ